MKEHRQAKILEIIRRQDVDTQEELCALLNREGFRVTQATVSRDIRELKLTKISQGGGKKKYVMLSDMGGEGDDKYYRVFRDGVVSIDMAQNILVLRTVSGMAMAVALAVDRMDCREVVGSIAGDDTVMCAVRTVEETSALMQRLRGLLR
ncbi:MAG: arginine repressor [Lachnospiraceae bacterium]|nr:arginine repressor [Lachnospiraceae bacterium]